MTGQFQFVGQQTRTGPEVAFKKSVGVNALKFEAPLFATEFEDGGLGSIRPEHACKPTALQLADTKDFEGIAVTGFNDGIKIVVWQGGWVHEVLEWNFAL
jgi:hypothetical protein